MSHSEQHRSKSVLDTEPQESHRRIWDTRRQAFRALHEEGCFVKSDGSFAGLAGLAPFAEINDLLAADLRRRQAPGF